MADYNVKDVFYLDTTLATGTSFDAGTQISKVLDVSSYVNPIAMGRNKGTGLAVYKVQFDRGDSSGNRPVVAAETSAFRVGLIAGFDTTQATPAATDLATDQLSASNDLMIAGVDYYSPSSVGANKEIAPTSGMAFLEPSTEVPYIVVRDSIGLVAVNAIDTTASMHINVRLSCAIIKLDQSTLNQLLRTQTV